jgi:hypothetical protein
MQAATLAGLVNYADWELTEHGRTPAIAGDGNSGLPGTRRWVRSNQRTSMNLMVLATPLLVTGVSSGELSHGGDLRPTTESELRFIKRCNK